MTAAVCMRVCMHGIVPKYADFGRSIHLKWWTISSLVFFIEFSTPTPCSFRFRCLWGSNFPFKDTEVNE